VNLEPRVGKSERCLGVLFFHSATAISWQRDGMNGLGEQNADAFDAVWSTSEQKGVSKEALERFQALIQQEQEITRHSPYSRRKSLSE